MRLNLLKLILISAVVFAVFSAVSPVSAAVGSFDAQLARIQIMNKAGN
jgi:hypothetical protein